MKGTDCRLNLIRITNMLSLHTEVANCREIYNMLIALIELQKVGYASDNDRTPRAILRAYNQSYVFALSYITLYSTSKNRNSSARSIFGMPFHALSVHLPEMFRLICGKSIVAEQAERHFNKLRLGHYF